MPSSEIALDDGKGAVLGAQETDGLDNASHETRQQVDALCQIEGEEVFDET